MYRRIKCPDIICLLVAIFVFASGYSQRRLNNSDKKIINRLIYKLNRDFFSAEIKEKRTVNRDTIDSVIKANHGGYRFGHVTYTPDRKFKIFILEGEDCGSHCEPIYQGYIYDANGRKLDSLYSFLPVSTIHTLPGGMYLVLSKGVEGGGIVINDSMAACLLSAKSGKLVISSFRSSKRQKYSGLVIDDSSLRIWQGQYFTSAETDKDRPLLYFWKNKLFFNFKRDKYIAQGYFEYADGTFTQKEYKTIRYKSLRGI